MAKKTSRTAFTNKLKKRAGAGWSASRKKAAKAKGQRIPGGIVGGIAKLMEVKGDLDKKGNPYFRFGGGVIRPAEFHGVAATVFHGISESKTKTVDDKLDALSSDCQLLGIDTEDLELDGILAALEELVKEGETYFKFNTWQPDGSDNAFVFIQGLADEDELAEALNAAGEYLEVVEDEEGEGEEPEDPEEDDGWEAGNRVVVDYDGEDYAGEITEVGEESVTVTFDNGDVEEVSLADLREEEPEPEEESEDEGDEDEPPADDAEPEESEWEPEVEEIYGYQPPRGKLANCEVTAVQVKAKTVTLKREEDGKTFTKVPWSKLQDAE